MDVELRRGSEFRIEVPPKGKAKFVVCEGTGEVSGQELLLGKWYTVKEGMCFIFTYTGCKLKISAGDAFYYDSPETNVPYIFNVFYALHTGGKKKVLVVGEGRTTLANILVNYLVRKQEKVMGIDLDVHGGSLMFPGCLCAGVIEEPFGPVDPLAVQEQVCYFFGGFSALENTDLYEALVAELMESAEKKSFAGPQVIIGHKDISKEEIEKLVRRYDVDCLVVIGDEKLYHLVSLDDRKVYIPRFGGQTRRTTEQRRACIAGRVRSFFYGGKEEYRPSTISIQVSREGDDRRDDAEGGAFYYRVVQVGEEYMAPMSALPLGASRRISSTVVSDSQPVCGSVLGISSAKRMEDVSTSPVLGFLAIVEVISDEELRVLCPQPKCLKSKFLVQGKIRLLE